MADLAVLGQAGLWSLNPADVAIFFTLLAHHVPMWIDTDGTVWATLQGKAVYVARLHAPEDEEKED